MRARCGFAIVTVTAKALDGEPPTVHQRPASSGGTAMCCAGCAPRVKVKVDAFFGGVFVVVTSLLFRLSRRCHGRVGSIHHQKGELSLFFGLLLVASPVRFPCVIRSFRAFWPGPGPAFVVLSHPHHTNELRSPSGGGTAMCECASVCVCLGR